MSSLYNKKGNKSYAASELLEGCSFKYVPLKHTHQIDPTTCRKTKLFKAQQCQQYALERHNPIRVWGTLNIYLPLTAPNGSIFTICQVIMIIKSIVNFSSPFSLVWIEL